MTKLPGADVATDDGSFEIVVDPGADQRDVGRAVNALSAAVQSAYASPQGGLRLPSLLIRLRDNESQVALAWSWCGRHFDMTNGLSSWDLYPLHQHPYEVFVGTDQCSSSGEPISAAHLIAIPPPSTPVDNGQIIQNDAAAGEPRRPEYEVGSTFLCVHHAYWTADNWTDRAVQLKLIIANDLKAKHVDQLKFGPGQRRPIGVLLSSWPYPAWALFAALGAVADATHGLPVVLDAR